MRRIALILLLLTTTFVASAQSTWTELSSVEQRAVLASRRTPEVARRVMSSDYALSEIDDRMRDDVLRRIQSRTRDPHLEALYVYLYDILRSPDGSMASSDVRMLSAHTEAMLASWSAEQDCRKIYNYAYSIGRSGALDGERSVRRALRKMSKRHIYEQYGDVVVCFNRSQAIAYESVAAGSRTFEDVTPTVKAEDVLLLSSAEEYAAVKRTLKPIATTLEEPKSDIERNMRIECMAWSRSYNSYVEHTLSRNLTLVRSTRSDGEYLTFIDHAEDSYTVVNEVYILESGRFVVVERAAKPQSLILGYVSQRGSVDIIGRVYVDLGRELIGLRCTPEALYLHVRGADGRGEEYLKLQLL